MNGFLLVGLGGGLGAMLRYGVGELVIRHYANLKFPLTTFIVNVVGCLLIGLLAGLGEKHHLLSMNARLFLITGLLGGFTTFSAFGFETFLLLRRDELLLATFNVGTSIVCCIIAVWLGFRLGGIGASAS